MSAGRRSAAPLPMSPRTPNPGARRRVATMPARPHAHAPGEPHPPPLRDGDRQRARFPPPPKGVRVWAVGHSAGDVPVDTATEAKRPAARRAGTSRVAAAVVAAVLAAAILATVAAATIMLLARVGR